MSAEWQPIETYPMGEYVLAWDERAAAEWHDVSDPYVPSVARCVAHHFWTQHGDKVGCTHWMSLPPPPEPEAE